MFMSTLLHHHIICTFAELFVHNKFIVLWFVFKYSTHKKGIKYGCRAPNFVVFITRKEKRQGVVDFFLFFMIQFNNATVVRFCLGRFERTPRLNATVVRFCFGRSVEIMSERTPISCKNSVS